MPGPSLWELLLPLLPRRLLVVVEALAIVIAGGGVGSSIDRDDARAKGDDAAEVELVGVVLEVGDVLRQRQVRRRLGGRERRRRGGAEPERRASPLGEGGGKGGGVGGGEAVRQAGGGARRVSRAPVHAVPVCGGSLAAAGGGLAARQAAGRSLVLTLVSRSR